MNKQIGIVLLVVGIGLLIWGFNLYGAFSSKVARAFTGSAPDKTVIILISGAVCIAAGLFQFIRKSR
jgi:uncharacterized membrane protein